jgi:multidrug efflux pump subunit AcrA (membrane-fusion protein)
MKYIPDAAAALVINPGDGVFVQNVATTPLTLTFVGEVPQGNLSTALPKGFSIKANMVPQAIKPDQAGLPGEPGDKVFRYNKTTKNYNTFQFDDADLKWIPDPGLPVMPVGEAWFHYRAQSAGTWNRTFSVNG